MSEIKIKTEKEQLDELKSLRNAAIRESKGINFCRIHFDMLYRKDKKHGITIKRSEGQWDNLTFDEIPKIAVLHSAYRDVNIMNAAILMDELDFPCDMLVLVVGLNDIEEYEKGQQRRDWTTGKVTYEHKRPIAAEFASYLLEHGEVVFDIRDDSFPFKLTEGKNEWDYYWEYDGLRPYKPHVMDVRDEFISTLTRYWAGSFISGYDNMRSSSGGMLSLERAANLATALSLGQIEFDTATLKKVKAPSWQRDALRNVKFSDNTMPEGFENLDEEVEKAEALLAFWEKAADYYRFSMRIDRDELDDVEKLTELCRRCGEMIGVDVYLDTYAAGVPAEDILV